MSHPNANNQDQADGSSSAPSGDVAPRSAHAVAAFPSSARQAAIGVNSFSRGISLSTVPQFSGEAAHFLGWKAQMMAVLTLEELDVAVKVPLSGGGSASSVLGDECNEVEEVGQSGSSVAASHVATEQEVQRAMRAYTMILLALKTSELHALLTDVPCGNAFEAWKRLMDHFERSTQANKLALRAELAALRQGEGESVTVYVGRLRRIALSLQNLKAAPAGADLVIQFLNGLTDSFAMAKTMLAMMPGDRDLQQTLDIVLAEEARLNKTLERASGAHHHTALALGMEAGGGSSGAGHQGQRPWANGGGARPPPTCYGCGQQGHIRMNCPSTRKNAVCTYCKKQGHVEANCWSKGKSARGGAGGVDKAGLKPGVQTAAQRAAALQAALMVLQEYGVSHEEEAKSVSVVVAAAAANVGKKSGPERWLLDSGASSHCVTSAVKLEGSKIDASVKIRVASGELLEEPTVGSLKLKLGDGSTLMLHKVLSHPKMTDNLLSMSALQADTGAAIIRLLPKGLDVWTVTVHPTSFYNIK